MPTQSYQARDIKGLTPAIEVMNSDELYALNGLNYIFDSRGPKSFYGNRLLVPMPLGRPEHTQGFRLKLTFGDRVFVMTGDAILEWVEAVGGFVVLFVTPETVSVPYRWTFGYLNGVLYFCHPRTGILEYDLDTGILRPDDGPGVPEAAQAICINNGRLIAIDPEFYYWSAQSNGRDFNPTLGGAGFQQISDRVPGDPIMVTAYSRGTLTWCSGGVMRSEFTGDVEVFRHRAINSEYRPVNSFCTAQIDDDTVVILDERGLFQSQGESPTPYTKLFNEFLINYIQRFNLRVGQNIRLEWDNLQRLMYISVSLSFESAIYEQAFVLYPPLDKWGQFNEPHYGVIPGLVRTGSRADDYYSFVDANGFLKLWEEIGSREVLPVAGNLNFHYPPIQKPTQEYLNVDGLCFASSMKWSTWNESAVVQRAGFYEPEAATPVAPSVTGLGAKIQVGLITFDLGQANDQLTEVVQIQIANVTSGDANQAGLDYNLVPSGVSDEDYNLETGGEDFGLEPRNYINHKLRIISTLDGTTIFNSEEPSLTLFQKGVRYYSCSTTGLWHIVEVAAEDVGESFHLQNLRLTAAYAGRLM